MSAGNCIGDDDYKSAAEKQARSMVKSATTEAALRAGLALWDRNSSKSITNMKNEIDKRNIAMAEAVQRHAEQFWPYEKAIGEELFSKDSHPDANYGALTKSWPSLSDKSYKEGRNDWEHYTTVFCYEPTECEEVRWDRMKELNRADTISFADRQAERRADDEKDSLFGQKYKYLGIGRKLVGRFAAFNRVGGRAGENAGRVLADSVATGLSAIGMVMGRQESRNNHWSPNVAPYNPNRDTNRR